MSENSNTAYCYRHPDRETGLRCKTCGKPICFECAKSTPTGYSCQECLKGISKRFDTAVWTDYVIAFVVAAVLSWLGSLLVNRIGFWILLIGPVVGTAAAELIRRLIKGRRSKLLFQLAVAGVVIGCIPVLIWPVLALLSGNLSAFMGLVYPLIYMAINASTIYYRLSGISL